MRALARRTSGSGRTRFLADSTTSRSGRGSAGPSGKGGFAAAAGRYHLYVSLACPWAHRTIIFRKLKALENVISLSVVSPDMLENGWTFHKDEGSTGDTVNGKDKLSEIYVLADPKYTGRVSVPVL